VQIPAAFDYACADRVADALRLLTEHGNEARVMAGGHNRLPMVELRLARPQWAIDINDCHGPGHLLGRRSAR